MAFGLVRMNVAAVPELFLFHSQLAQLVVQVFGGSSRRFRNGSRSYCLAMRFGPALGTNPVIGKPT